MEDILHIYGVMNQKSLTQEKNYFNTSEIIYKEIEYSSNKCKDIK